MPIDPRRLRVLRALADHGTVTAAGRALHLTPSAVSQQLAALESEAGQDLLRRKGRRVWLTSAGELLVDHATAVLAELDRAEARLAELGAGRLGKVRVAAFASAIVQVVAPAVRHLRAHAPGITIQVCDAEGHDSLPMLLDGEIDIAITMEHRALTADDRTTRDPLYTEPFDAVLPPNHPAPGPTISLTDLATDDWITPAAGNPCRDVVLLACEHAGFAPRITHTSDDFAAESALVDAGVGVALIPRTAAHGTRVLPVAGDPPTRRVFAAIRRGREDHPLITTVRAALRTAADSRP
jgi:DNA-binding transcriptional LysR family regulator